MNKANIFISTNFRENIIKRKEELDAEEKEKNENVENLKVN